MVALPKIKQQDKIECLGRHSPTSSKGKHNERHEHGTDGRRADAQTRGWIIRKEDLTIIATRKKTHFFSNNIYNNNNNIFNPTHPQSTTTVPTITYMPESAATTNSHRVRQE